MIVCMNMLDDCLLEHACSSLQDLEESTLVSGILLEVMHQLKMMFDHVAQMCMSGEGDDCVARSLNPVIFGLK